MAHPELFRTASVSHRSSARTGLPLLDGPAGPLSAPMLVDQTHESVVVGDRAVVKWAVRAEPTPAPVLIAHLRAAGFKEMPEPWGFVSWANGSR